MKESYIMEIVAKIAETTPFFARAKIAAALVYKNEIISIGTNKNKTHPFQKKFSVNSDAIFLHAETDAIYNATRKYDTEIIAKSKLYVSRVKYFDGNKKYFVQGISRPCDGCQRAIANFNIKHVCFTKDNEGFEYL